MMEREDMFEVGMNLNSIAQSVDNETFERIKPYLDKIEEVILKYADKYVENVDTREEF